MGIHSESDMEAHQSREKLQIMIETVLTENTALRQRLLDSDPSSAHSIIATRHQDADETATIRDGHDEDDDNNSTITKGQVVDRSNMMGSVRSRPGTFLGGIIQFAFENILEQSRVYRKTAHVLECDRSFASSAGRSHAWSAFTGYSLADISVLSVIAMPLTGVDVSNGVHYQLPEEDETFQEQDGFDRSTSVCRTTAEDDRKTPTQQAVEEEGRATPTQLTFQEDKPNTIASAEIPTSDNPQTASLKNKAAGMLTNSGSEVAEVGGGINLCKGCGQVWQPKKKKKTPS